MCVPQPSITVDTPYTVEATAAAAMAAAELEEEEGAAAAAAAGREPLSFEDTDNNDVDDDTNNGGKAAGGSADPDSQVRNCWNGRKSTRFSRDCCCLSVVVITRLKNVKCASVHPRIIIMRVSCFVCAVRLRCVFTARVYVARRFVAMEIS